MTDQGFQKMDDAKQRKIASEGGKASGTAKNDSQNMSELGKKGAQAQSTEDKAKGGMNSHPGSE